MALSQRFGYTVFKMKSVEAEIEARLSRAEREHGVRILFAIESGSRAWGFASPDSDYDVRFIYARPAEWYLSLDLEHRRDVIEYPIEDDIDLNGWDVRKALTLFWRSNPAFVEWVRSPIVYREDGAFLDQVLTLLPQAYSPRAGFYHYRSMAVSNSAYVAGDSVRLKKYLYVLRPLLAMRWLIAHGTPPPVEFDAMRSLVSSDAAVTRAIEELLVKKKASGEVGEGPPVPELSDFIASELARPVPELPDRGAAADYSKLNDLFRSSLH